MIITSEELLDILIDTAELNEFIDNQYWSGGIYTFSFLKFAEEFCKEKGYVIIDEDSLEKEYEEYYHIAEKGLS
jgi:hypothetical protein